MFHGGMEVGRQYGGGGVGLVWCEYGAGVMVLGLCGGYGCCVDVLFVCVCGLVCGVCLLLLVLLVLWCIGVM